MVYFNSTVLGICFLGHSQIGQFPNECKNICFLFNFMPFETFF